MKKDLLFSFFILVLFIVVSGFFACSNGSDSKSEAGVKQEGRFKMGQTRKPAVAGQFYPGDPVALSRQITGFFKNANKEPVLGDIVALISPHAGYMYSGQVAAHAFKLLEGLSFETVVVISPSHMVPFRGASVYNGGAYETPLGKIPVDTAVAGAIADAGDKVSLSATGHALMGGGGEHSLEVELPFLQLVLGNFKLVPIVMGDQDWATCQALGQALAKSLEGKRALIVASTDLSHFHPYDEAVRLDNVVMGNVDSFDPKGLFSDLAEGNCEACGGGPMIAAMLAGKTLGADKSKVLKYANSGDVTGDRSSVVGYMAAVIYDSEATSKKRPLKSEEKAGTDEGLSEKDRETLVNIARTTIEHRVKGNQPPKFTVDSPILKEKRGAFVTIHKHKQLRGCIGYIEAVKPLGEAIVEMAVNAATKDYRFPPLEHKELSQVEIEISVLSPKRKIKDAKEIKLGEHGVIVEAGGRGGVFLPQVAAETGWDLERFMGELCSQKAGLSPDAWKKGECDIYVFTAQVFHE